MRGDDFGLKGMERIGDPRHFDKTMPPSSCPYRWCGDGTRGCRRDECIAHAKGCANGDEERCA